MAHGRNLAGRPFAMRNLPLAIAAKFWRQNSGNWGEVNLGAKESEGQEDSLLFTPHRALDPHGSVKTPSMSVLSRMPANVIRDQARVAVVAAMD
jgi:hypothetical protein